MASAGDKTVSNKDVSRMLDAFEDAIDDLRISYEKYFMGVDRQAPANKHRAVKLQMRRIEEVRPRSTALRFRFSGLKARLVTYQHYWNRILGQIERGTFRRDLQQRTQRRKEDLRPPLESAPNELEQPAVGPPSVPADTPRPRDSTDISAPRPAAPSKGPPRPPPPPVPVPGMKGSEIRRLFQDLVQAKRAAGEDTQGLTMRALARKLSREVPKLRQRHGGAVKFEVATVGGKVRLRARPAGGAE